MNTKFSKRFFAYIIDAVIVSFVMSFISVLFTTKNIQQLKQDYSDLNETMLSEKLDLGVYYSRVADITHSMDKENFMINIVNFVIIILYFVVLPLYTSGQTLGKKFFKIRTVRDDNEDLTANDLILRNVIVNGLLNTLLAFCLVFLLSGFEYYTTVSILGFIQFAAVIASGIMIRVRKDKKGLQDLLTHTHVKDETLEV